MTHFYLPGESRPHYALWRAPVTAMDLWEQVTEWSVDRDLAEHMATRILLPVIVQCCWLPWGVTDVEWEGTADAEVSRGLAAWEGAQP